MLFSYTIRNRFAILTIGSTVIIGPSCIFLAGLLSGCQTAPTVLEQKTNSAIEEVASPWMGEEAKQEPTDSQTEAQSQFLVQPLPQPLVDQMGYILYDPRTHKVLTQLNPKKAFIPSSVTKVLSTVAALKILGPQYRFKTEVLVTGKIHNKILHGDLYLKGTGDPLLTASHLMSMVQRLKAKGISKVRGQFYYDDSYFHTEETIDSKRDFEESYNTGISALSAEFNQVPLLWKPGKNSVKSSKVMEAYTLPEYPLIELPKSPDSLSALNALSTKKQKLPIRNPSAFTAYFFKALASMDGLTLPEPQPKKLSPKASLKAITMATHHSLPLVELVEKILEYSNNTMAELIQLAAGRKLSGKPVDIKMSAKKIAKWLKQKMPHTQWKDLILENASGLGADNRITPEQLVATLAYADQPSFMPNYPYLSLLSVSGWKGTLSRRLRTPDLGLKVWAKTGTQSFCNSLAGYLFTQKGQKLVFAIVATDFKNRAKYDLNAPSQDPSHDASVASKLSREAKGWAGRMQWVQDRLLMDWIRSY